VEVSLEDAILGRRKESDIARGVILKGAGNQVIDFGWINTEVVESVCRFLRFAHFPLLFHLPRRPVGI
jgi:hypothetical protein